MLRYLIFIIIGILLYLLLNIYNTFSIGGIIRIPLGTSLVVDQIYFMDSEHVPHTPKITRYTFQPIDHIYFANGQYYYYTDINMQDIYDENGYYDDNLIEIINNNITEIQERERQERERQERERQEIERQERERQERERQERERQEIERHTFLTMMQESNYNLFRNGDIVIFTDNTGYHELVITTRGAITGCVTCGGNPRGGMTGGRIQLPRHLPGYMDNTPRMYFVVRPLSLNSQFGSRIPRYTIAGFGGHNIYPSGRYIQDLIRLSRFVPISDINIIFHDASESNITKRDFIELLDTLRKEFNRIHDTRLDITDFIRPHIYSLHCAAIAESIPPS